MRLCMFHPLDHPMERGWVGRIDGDRVIHLAAQTLQSFFTGGGTAREHAEYPLAGVRLLAPVLHPPTIRIFESQTSFAFANPAAIVGPGAAVLLPPSDTVSQGRLDGVARVADEESAAARAADRSVGRDAPSDTVSQGGLGLVPRLAALIGADGAIAGFTGLGEWRDTSRPAPKDRDFALGLGPVLATPDELDPDGVEAVVRVDGAERTRGSFPTFDWSAARELAAAGTTLRPGDLLAGPGLGAVEVAPGSAVELEIASVGVLDATVLRD